MYSTFVSFGESINAIKETILKNNSTGFRADAKTGFAVSQKCILLKPTHFSEPN